jgi:hypothetical protein
VNAVLLASQTAIFLASLTAAIVALVTAGFAFLQAMRSERAPGMRTKRPDRSDEIEKAKQLLDEGVLTQEQFEAVRARGFRGGLPPQEPV